MSFDTHVSNWNKKHAYEHLIHIFKGILYIFKESNIVKKTLSWQKDDFGLE